MDHRGSTSWHALSDILGSAAPDLAPIRSCADVATKCAEESTAGVRARQYCPVTCGCHDPAAPLALSSAEEGCPVSCVESEQHAQKLGNLSCMDWTAESPRILG